MEVRCYIVAVSDDKRTSTQSQFLISISLTEVIPLKKAMIVRLEFNYQSNFNNTFVVVGLTIENVSSKMNTLPMYWDGMS